MLSVIRRIGRIIMRLIAKKTRLAVISEISSDSSSTLRR